MFRQTGVLFRITSVPFPNFAISCLNTLEFCCIPTPLEWKSHCVGIMLFCKLSAYPCNPNFIVFSGFDNTCDLSAILGILSNASVFHARIQTTAKDVRAKVRNEWGHCNFDHWTEPEFQNCFQLMETLIRSLGLPKADEDKELDDLHDWETKG